MNQDKKNIDLNLVQYSFTELIKETGNIYKSINIIIRRAKYLHVKAKQDLDTLLTEFGKPLSANDTSYLEEAEQICKSFDAQPKAHLVAINELLAGDLVLVKKDEKEESELE